MVLMVSKPDTTNKMFYYLSSGKSFRDVVHDIEEVTSESLDAYVTSLASSPTAQWKLNRDEEKILADFSTRQITEVAPKSFYELEQAIPLDKVIAMSGLPAELFQSGKLIVDLDKRTRMQFLSTYEMMAKHHMYFDGLTNSRLITYGGELDPFRFVGYENYTVFNNRVSFK